MTAKLKLQCLATNRPAAIPGSNLLVFICDPALSSPCFVGIKKATVEYIQDPVPTDDTRFYVPVEDAAFFLSFNNLLDISQPPNPEVEAYRKAYKAWCSSDLSDKVSGPGYSETRELFISHEVLKDGFTFSEGFYNKYC